MVFQCKTRPVGLEPTTFVLETNALPIELRTFGMTGFEPATLCSQSRCATKLRYIPFNSSQRLVYKILIITATQPQKPSHFEPLVCAHRVFKTVTVGLCSTRA